MLRGHVDFVGELARVAHPEEASGNASARALNTALADGEERERRIRHVDVGHAREHVTRFRSRERRRRPLLGDRGDEDLEL